MRLTATFALVSVVAMTVLGAALVWTSMRLLQEQALLQANRTAEAYVSTGVERWVAKDAWAHGTLDPATVRTLDALFRPGPDSSLVGVRLWTGDGVLVYDSTQAALRAKDGATSAPASSAADGVTALGGIPDPTRFQDAIRRYDAKTSSALTDDVDAAGQPSRRLDVYAPVTYGGVSPSGVAEVVLSYDETGAAVRTGTTTILWVAFGGLALLWLLLFRTVHKASRRLRTQASENARLALLDPLTGLPNRRLFNDRLDRAAAVSARSGIPLALLLLDIDRFKDVNDTLGHPRGDALLVEVANRLRSTIRDADTVARLGGDEFAILLPVVESIEAAELFARRVRGVFDEPFDLEGMLLHVDTSVGLAVLPDHADDVTSLMARADIAMYTAKEAGLGLATYSSQSGEEDATSRLMLLGDLRRALGTEDELSLHYQPKVDLATGEVVGLEALLRWMHPQLGPVPPAEFIPVAEQTGLMQQLTARVLGLVAAQLSVWRRDGQELPVAVNLSARNLLEAELDTFVTSLLDMHDLPPSLLEFEVTESAIVEDPERATAMLHKLTALGMTVAVDDFGIGNTSIGQLGTLPLGTVKIDQSFVTNLAHDDTGQVLVKAIVELAHEFGMIAVAEGVEDAGAIDRLRHIGCDVAQGYHWSRPVPADELPAVVARIDAEARRTAPAPAVASVAPAVVAAGGGGARGDGGRGGRR
jgi:diguanylate cyclase (GGDEF)-like protein